MKGMGGCKVASKEHTDTPNIVSYYLFPQHEVIKTFSLLTVIALQSPQVTHSTNVF